MKLDWDLSPGNPFVVQENVSILEWCEASIFYLFAGALLENMPQVILVEGNAFCLFTRRRLLKFYHHRIGENKSCFIFKEFTPFHFVRLNTIVI